jgi:hypothetical protein
MTTPVNDADLNRFLGWMLDWTPEELAAPGTYAAYHWDEAYEGELEVDWAAQPPVTPRPAEALVYGRDDMDLARSLYSTQAVDPDRVTDTGVRNALQAQEDALFGTQIQGLLAQGRGPEALRHPDTRYGRLLSGTSLLDAARALFLLQPGLALLEPEEDEPGLNVETEFLEVLEGIFPAEVARHLGCYFQTPDATRFSGGANWDGPVDEEQRLPSVLLTTIPGVEILSTWWLGEGQGGCALVRLPDGFEEPGAPADEGVALLRRPPVDRTPFSLEFLEHPAAEVLAAQVKGNREVDHILVLLESGDFPAVMKTLADQGHVLWVANVAGQLCQEGLPFAALVLLEGMAPHATGQDVVFLQNNRSAALSLIHQHQQALDAMTTAEAAWNTHGSDAVPGWILFKNLAWEAYNVGELDRALSSALNALVCEPTQPQLHGIVGAILLARGEERVARAALERCLETGVAPQLGLETTSHPVYRELALTYAVPVELTPDEAARAD